MLTLYYQIVNNVRKFESVILVLAITSNLESILHSKAYCLLGQSYLGWPLF